jgi:hypothetical protein
MNGYCTTQYLNADNIIKFQNFIFDNFERFLITSNVDKNNPYGHKKDMFPSQIWWYQFNFTHNDIQQLSTLLRFGVNKIQINTIQDFTKMILGETFQKISLKDVYNVCLNNNTNALNQLKKNLEKLVLDQHLFLPYTNYLPHLIEKHKYIMPFSQKLFGVIDPIVVSPFLHQVPPTSLSSYVFDSKDSGCSSSSSTNTNGSKDSGCSSSSSTNTKYVQNSKSKVSLDDPSNEDNLDEIIKLYCNLTVQTDSKDGKWFIINKNGIDHIMLFRGQTIVRDYWIDSIKLQFKGENDIFNI